MKFVFLLLETNNRTTNKVNTVQSIGQAFLGVVLHLIHRQTSVGNLIIFQFTCCS